MLNDDDNLKGRNDKEYLSTIEIEKKNNMGNWDHNVG
jgi:hypothetical protein